MSIFGILFVVGGVILIVFTQFEDALHATKFVFAGNLFGLGLMAIGAVGFFWAASREPDFTSLALENEQIECRRLGHTGGGHWRREGRAANAHDEFYCVDKIGALHPAIPPKCNSHAPTECAPH